MAEIEVVREIQKTFVILLYPGVTLLDVSGPAQVFAAVCQENEQEFGNINLIYVSEHGGSIETDVALSVNTVPFYCLDTVMIDTLLIPGGPGVWKAIKSDVLVARIRDWGRSLRRVASVCLGAFLLAEAGLLDGRRAVTHWRQCDSLRQRFPRIDVREDSLFQRDENIWTSAGVSAGIDLALAIVEQDYGRATALAIARRLVVFLKRPGGQSQFSTLLHTQICDVDCRLTTLHAWIASNLTSKLSVEVLAAKVGMSPRTFARFYKMIAGSTPAASVEAFRVEAARRMLEDGDLASISEIARRAGFGDDERMRRAFIKLLGISPTDYRRSFSI
ncbi:GlxA family transcriptional regulator [Gluconacetobacter asukensis]|uniref:Helix-turn-helix domain-containing protein n=1 Tax=Gluconacetobacter asukensis TaxID=1017181 RepID=A0A7W4J2V8_9PROT|nr:helix-turn-helix domain-containing protein [Gluconacetobacter asukensis]MBB2173438.1 helix-turn-helix domain-containing protein [Gluconacetobacter asukensis]